MVAPLIAAAGVDERVLVGPDTGDDAGVYRFEGTSLVATVDFITPVCDDAERFGRVAAANSISDVWAMGGRPLFGLNLCCFPERVPKEVLTSILKGGADTLRDAGAALLGGHTVQDKELKYGMAVIGQADPDELITTTGAKEGQRLILTKPIGTGVMINAFKLDKLDEAGLEPALVEMERLNAVASQLAREHGVQGGTDITGFGLVGHALGVAVASEIGVRIDFDKIPTYEAFETLVSRGGSTGSTRANRENVGDRFEDAKGLNATEQELMFDPQTSGGLLLAVAPQRATALLAALRETGHRAAEIGEVVPGPPRVTVT